MHHVLPKISKPLVLVGLMGAGKSSVGRKLARRLGLAFADADEEIEKAAGQSISDMFERFGEAHFRDGERRVIARLVEGPPKVVSTGGGAFINGETRALVLERCIAIWLDADIGVLAKRVARRDNRPLLKGKDAQAVLTELAEKRNPFYAEAQVRIRSDEAPHEDTVERILAALLALENKA